MFLLPATFESGLLLPCAGTRVPSRNFARPASAAGATGMVLDLPKTVVPSPDELIDPAVAPADIVRDLEVFRLVKAAPPSSTRWRTPAREIERAGFSGAMARLRPRNLSRMLRSVLGEVFSSEASGDA